MTQAQSETASDGTAVEHGQKPILILFADDSTLFFALRMRELLWQTSGTLPLQLAWVSDQNALSYRQMSQLLPEGPDRIIRDEDFEEVVIGGDFLAIITSRVFRPLGEVLKRRLVKHMPNRACVIAFLGGLDFFPENGYFHRRHCDSIYLFPRSEIPAFSDLMMEYDIGWQDVGFGHPFAMHPKPAPEDLNMRRDIYFFTQALSPSTRHGRIHMLNICIALARANPDRTVWIKLRHLPHENRSHLHKERFDYPGLLEQMQDVPDNLKLTACSMKDVLSRAAVGITCTSTAAVDLVSEGIPCMVYLDYVDHFCDPLTAPMRRLFADSGLITELDDILRLNAHMPTPQWVDNMFCPSDLGERLLSTINNFQMRPFQLPDKVGHTS